MKEYMPGTLRCPSCRGGLKCSSVQGRDDRIVQAEAACRSCSSMYPVREETGLFLTPDLPGNDLWKNAES